ncbi:hypothetical protein ACQ4PT_069599 [Festuca glaucescens]
MAALSHQFGPLFRLRFGIAEVVVAASAKVASQFLRAHDANFSDRPPNSGAEHVAYNYQDLVFAPYGSRWRALRKLCALHLFSAKALDALRAVREAEVALMNLFTAGTDTTSSTVEWALAELIRHRDVLTQAQRELDDVVGQDRLVRESDLPSLTFLTAVIKETFRLHPSTPLSLPRVAAEDCEVDGYRIPKGTTLLVNVWAIARDPASWGPDALEFRPARFLAGGLHESVDVKGSDYELIPFGAGRRICAGLSWGLRMVTLMTATLVHAFDWSLVDGLTPEKLDMEEAYGLTLQRAAPLMVRPVPRLLSSAYAV